MQAVRNSPYFSRYEELNPNDDFVYFGTKPKVKEDTEVKKRKMVTVADQIATDNQGRRRFHGAFTGGFSAGYYNTCGSEEGWTPTTFASSKTNRKSSDTEFKPEDFMDAEDMMEHGIAPLQIKPTQAYQSNLGNNSAEKGKVSSVDEELFNKQFSAQPDRSMGFVLLRALGWKEGRGVGERIAIKLNPNTTGSIPAAKTKVYGCELPVELKETPTAENVVWISPQDAVSNVPTKKDNLFGLGYVDLRHISRAFREGKSGNKDASSFEFKPIGSEKKGIHGTAFGIGAFEDDEETDDVYHYDKLSDYNFGIEEVDDDKNDIYDDKNQTQASSKLRETKYSQFWKVSKNFEQQMVLPECNSYLMKMPHNYKPSPVLGPERHAPTVRNFKQLDSVQKALIIGDISVSEAAKISSSQASSKPDALLVRNTHKSHSSLLEFKASLSSRFVSSGTQIIDVGKANEDNDQQNASQMEMFGPLTRTVELWQPETLLCRRFNVRCPLVIIPESGNSRTDQDRRGYAKNESYKSRETFVKTEDSSSNRIAHRPMSISGPLTHLNPINKLVSIPQSTNSNTVVQTEPSKPETEIEEEDRNFDMFAAVFGDDEVANEQKK